MMENNYRIGVKEGMYSFLCRLACFLFCFGWSLLFETEVSVSMYKKEFRIKDIYLRPALHRDFYMSYQIEFYQAGEGGALAQLSPTGPSARE